MPTLFAPTTWVGTGTLAKIMVGERTMAINVRNITEAGCCGYELT